MTEREVMLGGAGGRVPEASSEWGRHRMANELTLVLSLEN